MTVILQRLIKRIWSNTWIWSASGKKPCASALKRQNRSMSSQIASCWAYKKQSLCFSLKHVVELSSLISSRVANMRSSQRHRQMYGFRQINAPLDRHYWDLKWSRTDQILITCMFQVISYCQFCGSSEFTGQNPIWNSTRSTQRNIHPCELLTSWNRSLTFFLNQLSLPCHDFSQHLLIE